MRSVIAIVTLALSLAACPQAEARPHLLRKAAGAAHGFVQGRVEGVQRRHERRQARRESRGGLFGGFFRGCAGGSFPD